MGSNFINSKRKRNVLTVVQKLDLINRLENGENRRVLMNEFKIGSSTIYDIKSQKRDLLKFASAASMCIGNRRTLHKPKSEQLDTALFKWCSSKQQEGIKVSRLMLIERAKEMHEQMEIKEHCAFSEGWLNRFKTRHGIKFDIKASAKKQSHNQEVEDDIKEDDVKESFKLSHNNHLSIVLDSLASDESFMDVTLTAQGKSIKAHKSVLSAVSPYFKSVLKENPCQHPIIIMPRDITFEQLKNIIVYVYKGEMTVAASELSNLLKTAELLQVSGLSPSETGGSAFTEETCSPEQTLPAKWMEYSSSPFQRTVKTPVKSTKSSSKKRPRTPSRDNSPSSKRNAMQDNSEITCVKEEIQSGNEFEETEYPPANSGVDDPGENSASFSMASDPSDNEERVNAADPLLLPKTELTSETLFECAFCEKSFPAKEQQETHMKSSHPNKQICVCNCGKSFETPVDLEDHKQSCLMI